MKFYNGLKGMYFELPNGSYSQPLAVKMNIFYLIPIHLDCKLQ